MRVLICGSRHWSDRATIRRFIATLGPDDIVIHGRAPGADTIAGDLADRRNLAVFSFPAQWRRFGDSAGPKRNARMLEEGKPERVVAFHADLERSKGTGDMVRRARAAGIPVAVITGREDV